MLLRCQRVLNVIGQLSSPERANGKFVVLAVNTTAIYQCYGVKSVQHEEIDVKVCYRAQGCCVTMIRFVWVFFISLLISIGKTPITRINER